MANSRTNFTQMYGSVNVPNQAACSATPGVDAHVKWVGLGGWNGDDRLLQNGIAQDGVPATNYAWFEGLNATYDTTIAAVGGFRVNSGDQINISTTYTPANHYVTFGFHNLTNGDAAAPSTSRLSAKKRADMSAPATLVNVSDMYSGNSAEAIDERPYDYNTKKLDQLRKFSASGWTSAGAATGGSSTRAPIRNYGYLALSMWSVSKTNHIADALQSAGSNYDFTDRWNSCGTKEAIAP